MCRRPSPGFARCGVPRSVARATRRTPRPGARGIPRARRRAPRPDCRAGSPDAIAGALHLEKAIEEATDLRERLPLGVGEAGLERALEKRADDLIEDGVAQVFLALEVVVEV